jgi:hypothetical protein
MKDHLSELKSKLEQIEKTLESKIETVNTIGTKWETYEERVKELREIKEEDIIQINVGGKKFATRYDTLLSVKDNLFHKIIMSGKMDIRKGIFIDRSPTYFWVILDYLRYQKFNPARFTTDQLIEIKDEVLYYEILTIEGILEKTTQTLEYVKINVSAWYDGIPVDAKSLLDPNLNIGVITNSPGWMEVEFNKEVEFENLEIGGFTGKSDWVYSTGYGANGRIQTSRDGKTYNNVGTVPSGFGQTIVPVKVTKSTAKFIKIIGDSWLGIGYLKIKTG